MQNKRIDFCPALLFKELFDYSLSTCGIDPHKTYCKMNKVKIQRTHDETLVDPGGIPRVRLSNSLNRSQNKTKEQVNLKVTLFTFQMVEVLYQGEVCTDLTVHI